jgi:hypothetical protein
MKFKFKPSGSLVITFLTIGLWQSIVSGQIISGIADETEIVELTVSPAAAPSPTFKHRLTWLPHETTPGNAASVYLHSLSENALSNRWKKTEQLVGEGVYDFLSYELPRELPKEIPLEKLKQASGIFDDYIAGHIARASKRRDCDWGLGLEDLEGELVISLSLNGLNETRSISRALALQTRLAILESRYEEAVDLMRMNYRLGENVGKVKVLVAGLIGIAEVNTANRNMLDFIAAPDSPNMFWALTELPRPLIDLRGAFRIECHTVERMFPEIASAENESHSPEEWSRILKRIIDKTVPLSSILSGSGMPQQEPKPLQKLLPAALGIFAYSPAKKRLIASGMKADDVEAMAVGQVLLMDAGRESRQVAEMFEKEIYLPLPGAIKRSKALENKLRDLERGSFNSFGKIASLMILPAIQQVRNSQGRCERDIDALRVIEAVRMHAAETGTLPKSLEDIKVVPVPNNPVTGKPFRYSASGETATLDLPYSDGISAGSQRSKRFKIKLRK